MNGRSDDRPILPAELPRGSVGRPLEPAIERLRAGHDDARRVDAVELDALPPAARRFHTEHQVGPHPDQPLRRQVVPARNAGAAGMPSACALFTHVRLAAPRGDQRRDEHGVRRARRDEALDAPAARDGALANA